jgi:hypothetical protein
MVAVLVKMRIFFFLKIKKCPHKTYRGIKWFALGSNEPLSLQSRTLQTMPA